MDNILQAVFNGFFLALGLIIPLGAQNAFVLNQGVRSKKYLSVLPVVITASLSDTFLILVAVSGVSMLLLHFFWVKILLLMFGILFMVYVGIVSWKEASVPSNPDQFKEATVYSKVLSTLFISLFNPYAILDTVGVIGVSSTIYHGISKTAFTVACVFVSWMWFFLLAGVGKFVRKIKSFYHFQNKISAIIIWVNAIFLIINLFSEMY